MEVSRKPCRLCLTETEFNVSLFGGYCRRTGMSDKILVCLKIVVEETDHLYTICFKCAGNVEKYYEFISFVKKSQTKLGNGHHRTQQTSLNMEGSPTSHVKRHVTSYVREQVIDADYTFSFLAAPEEKESVPSNPFSYFQPPNMLLKRSIGHTWKTPLSVHDDKNNLKRDDYKRPCKSSDLSQANSRDLFESQSQDVNEPEPRSLDWKITPDDNIIKRIRDRCFGRSDF